MASKDDQKCTEMCYAGKHIAVHWQQQKCASVDDSLPDCSISKKIFSFAFS